MSFGAPEIEPVADAVIHAPDKDGDQRNMHAHVMVVMRKLDGSEFAAKKERAADNGERKAELESLRESWERIGNRHLERYGHAPTLDRRSLLAQGIEREPTAHMGKTATALERSGQASELGDLNREIRAENERRVIDLAAERAMREARQAAKGRVDDVRPDVSAVASAEARQAAQEVTQKRERDETPGQTAEPFHGSGKTASAAVARPEPGIARGTRQTVAAAEKTVDQATHVFSRMLGGLGSAVEKMLSGLFDFLAPPPKLTPDQAERAERAAAEAREARADEAARQDKEAARDELLVEQERQRQQKAQDLYSRFGGALTRDPDDHGRERDDDRGRERERER